MNGYIYAIINTVTDKRYIGQTKNRLSKRKYEHFSQLRKGEHWNNKLQASFNKHGEENFLFQCLYEHQSGSPIHKFRLEMDELEVGFIEEYDTVKNGYNLTTGGKSCVVSDETRIRMSASKMGERNTFYGRKHKPGAFDEREAWNKGMKGWRPGSVKDGFHQEETREKIAASTRAARSSITAEQAIEICSRALAGEKYKSLSEEFGISGKVISDIKRGVRWADVTKVIREG